MISSFSAKIGPVRLRSPLRRPRRGRASLRSQAGFTLIELLATMAILSIVIGGLTVVFVSATHAELDTNRRFQAQEQARLALDKLRREVHCASSLTVSSASTITITLPSYCFTSGGTTQTVMWCVSGSSAPYALYRIAPSTGACTGGTRWAGSLTSSTAPAPSTWFSAAAPPAGQLATLHVDLPVNVNPGSTIGSYDLNDDIALRNSARS